MGSIADNLPAAELIIRLAKEYEDEDALEVQVAKALDKPIVVDGVNEKGLYFGACLFCLGIIHHRQGLFGQRLIAHYHQQALMKPCLKHFTSLSILIFRKDPSEKRSMINYLRTTQSGHL